MGRQFTVSNMGLKLIKAYEGYRPVDRMLVSGHRVIGYGHRVLDDETKFLSKSEAETVLKTDLAPFEDMINENVHAPLTQSQFDALCSFAFNIGPKAFMQSDTLRALNNGRPLDAANGFDIWRKSEIDGKTYVVDALMRRRTAEKALFLRPEGRTLSAPRIDLPPVSDETVALLRTEDGLPVFSREDSTGVVVTSPYDAGVTNKGRRRTDNPSGILSLSDVYEDEFEEDLDEDVSNSESSLEEDLTLETELETEQETTKPTSLIAAEDAKLKDRLDALIEDVKSDQKGADTTDWPETLISAAEESADVPEEYSKDNVVEFMPDLQPESDVDVLDEIEITGEDDSVDLVIDNLKQDDAIRVRSDDSASKYIEIDDTVTETGGTNLPYWVMIVFGAVLLGSSVAAYLRGSVALLGETGPMITLSGALIGSMMLMGALYYAFRKTLSRLSEDE